MKRGSVSVLTTAESGRSPSAAQPFAHSSHATRIVGSFFRIDSSTRRIALPRVSTPEQDGNGRDLHTSFVLHIKHSGGI